MGSGNLDYEFTNANIWIALEFSPIARHSHEAALIRSMLAALPPSFCHTVMASCGINQPSGKSCPLRLKLEQGAKFTSECRPPCAECGAAAPCAASPLRLQQRSPGERRAVDWRANIPHPCPLFHCGSDRRRRYACMAVAR